MGTGGILVCFFSTRNIPNTMYVIPRLLALHVRAYWLGFGLNEVGHL